MAHCVAGSNVAVVVAPHDVPAKNGPVNDDRPIFYLLLRDWYTYHGRTIFRCSIVNIYEGFEV